MKKCFVIVTMMSFISGVTAQEMVVWETYPDTWVTVDGLGRNVAQSDEGVTRRKIDTKCSIGMFYTLMHKNHGVNFLDSEYDVTEILSDNPENPEFGPTGWVHWWGEPLMGHYRGGTPFVVAKHLQMLTDAGVDFLFFDVTNAWTYDYAFQGIMREIDRRESYGLKSPKLVFFTHGEEKRTVEYLWDNYYSKPEYDKYWWEYEGKPLLLGNRESLLDTDKEGLLDRFTWKYCWAFEGTSQPDRWPWLDWDQPMGWTWGTKSTGEKYRKTEQIYVAVSYMAAFHRGRSFHNGEQPVYDKYALCEETPYGLCFQEHWDKAIAAHVPVLMVTQFNEWNVIRQTVGPNDGPEWTRPGAEPAIGQDYFADTYNGEFSRDIEPSKHPLIRDNYYLQAVSNMRKYRGVNSIPVPTVNMTIDIAGNFEQWNAETMEYRDDKGDTELTLAECQSATSLKRKSNDIIRAKVTKDDHYLYFYVETLEPIGMADGRADWMRLLINADRDYTTGWNGYDYMTAIDESTGEYCLMKYVGGNGVKWQRCMAVEYRVDGEKMHLKILKTTLGLLEDKDFDFKWVDNVAVDEEEIMRLIVDGESAPNGRFNYRYKGASLPVSGTGIGTTEAEIKTQVIVNGTTVTVNYEAVAGQEVVIEVYGTIGNRVQLLRPDSDTGYAEFRLQRGVYIMVSHVDGGCCKVDKIVVR